MALRLSLHYVLLPSVPPLPPNPIDVIESLMKLVALEGVKETFLAIKSKIEICHQQKARVKKDRFNPVFQGNPGTGMYNFVLGE